MSQTIKITITGSDPTNCSLTLSDGGTTEASPGDKIQWVIGPNSGVSKINKISVDQGSKDVFSPDPAQLPNSTTWEGTINPAIDVVEQEAYTIEWVVAGSGWLNQGGGKVCSYDPIIRVKPNS